MSGRRKRLGGKFSKLAPVLTLGLLIAVGVDGRISPEKVENATAYFDAVRASVESLPRQIGRWTGRDVPVQPAAQELLRPNVLMQRRYTDPLSGSYVDLLIVHCGDVRDMIGHFPPVCYPANGWEMLGEGEAVRVPTRERTVDAMEYRFARSLEDRDLNQVIMNFFIGPDASDPVAPDYRYVSAAAGSIELAGLGAAQVQIITPSTMDASDRAAVYAKFTEALSPIVRRIASTETAAPNGRRVPGAGSEGETSDE